MGNSTLPCKYCKLYHPRESMQKFPIGKFCSDVCVNGFLDRDRKRRLAKVKNKALEVKRADKKKWAKRKSDFKASDVQHQHGLTQPVFNKMRKLQELQWFAIKGLEPVCISCMKPLGNDQWCNGHFKTVGSNGALRYDSKNSYLQHNFHCNMNKSGDINGYKMGLAARFGVKAANEIIDYCDTHNKVRKYTGEELQQMRKYFSLKVRELETQAMKILKSLG